jgi:hypothetical protein
VPKCIVIATKETRKSGICDQISDNVMDDSRNTCGNDADSTLRSVKVNEDKRHSDVGRQSLSRLYPQNKIKPYLSATSGPSRPVIG